MRFSWRRTTVAFAVIAIVASGCGDDDEALTEEEFLEQGNAICVAGNDRIDALFEETFQSEADFEDEETIAEFKEALESDVQGQLDDLGELAPPEEFEDEVDALLDDGNAALDELREMDTQQFFETEGGGDVFAEVNRRADEIGLSACAEDGEDGGGGEPSAAAGHTVVDVTAAEYEFGLASMTLQAGPTALHLVNDGEEQHELSFARISEGHTLQQALEFEGDPEEAGLITDPSGDSGRIGPGEDIFLNVDLAPGTYGMVCFVEAPDGTPHAFKGMVVEFEVAE